MSVFTLYFYFVFTFTLLCTHKAVLVQGSLAAPRTLHVAAVGRAAAEAPAVTLRRADRLGDWR